MNLRRRTALLTALAIWSGVAAAQQKIYWGDEVPAGWHGQWPVDVQTVAERSAFTRTVSSGQLLEFISALKGKSENLHVVNMFVSPMRKAAPAIVISNPRVTSAQQARTSGKPVVFLFGNIHPPEPEAAEALMLVARDLAMGARKNLLDNQIVIIAPIFNIDGTDTFETQDGSLGSETPYIQGTRENAAGLDLNRDAVKLQAIETQGLYRVLNDWDPVLLLDGHLMSRVSHGYANTYGTTTVPAAAPGPRDYTHDTLFPAVRDMVRKEFGLEVFTHALPARGPFPPTVWSHDAAAWTVEAKFIVNDYGLRNRLAIITETPGQPTFERRIYAQYAYIMALLEYTNAHAKEMQAVVKKADDETVASVQAKAESGQLRNWLDGEYRSRGKIDLLAYRTNVPEYRPGTSILGTRPGTASGPPEVVHGVDDLTMPVGTRDAVVPRAYVLPADLADIAAKLRAHNIRIQAIDKPIKVEGEEFRIEKMRKNRSGGYDMTVLDGTFAPLATKEFPAGSFYVDMAQPMANAAFYYLEPQARDGFVGWSVLDDKLRALGADKGAAIYPIFKVRREMK
ncbi:MAG TPA: M14 family zinc carboxypeptidase [Vicinamibacterales bacterium]|nr:M14 family zinc carboxypeptidase [Vicinamibacterales bacterium]